MKKMLCIIMCVGMILGMPVHASAEEYATITPDTSEKSGEISIDYSLEENYIVTIPASVTFTDREKTAERGILVSEVSLREGRVLNVQVSSLNDFKMKNGEAYIDYSLSVNYNPSAEGNNYNILTVEAGERSGYAILDFATQLNKENASYAGKYTDALTFTVSVE